MRSKRKPIRGRVITDKQQKILAVRRVLRAAFDAIRYDKNQQDLVDFLAGCLGGSKTLTPEIYQEACSICANSGKRELITAVKDPRIAMAKPTKFKPGSQRWRPEQDDILRKHWPDFDKCVRKLKIKTASAVYTRARFLGLTRKINEEAVVNESASPSPQEE